ncbi:hypothetical protein AAY473_003990 [Plecturocebus cupreus]
MSHCIWPKAMFLLSIFVMELSEEKLSRAQSGYQRIHLSQTRTRVHRAFQSQAGEELSVGLTDSHFSDPPEFRVCTRRFNQRHTAYLIKLRPRPDIQICP